MSHNTTAEAVRRVVGFLCFGGGFTVYSSRDRHWPTNHNYVRWRRGRVELHCQDFWTSTEREQFYGLSWRLMDDPCRIFLKTRKKWPVVLARWESVSRTRTARRSRSRTRDIGHFRERCREMSSTWRMITSIDLGSRGIGRISVEPLKDPYAPNEVVNSEWRQDFSSGLKLLSSVEETRLYPRAREIGSPCLPDFVEDNSSSSQYSAKILS